MVLMTTQEKLEYDTLRADSEAMKRRIADLERQLHDINTHEARILSPTQGAFVEWKTLVKGQIFGILGAGEHLWLVVHPAESSGWYPQKSQIFPNPDGSWEANIAIGRENRDHGIQHDIAVVLASNSANKVFNDYLTRGNETKEFPEIPLPEDIRVLAKVSVVRKAMTATGESVR
jgi:hypothetical protein